MTLRNISYSKTKKLAGVNIQRVVLFTYRFPFPVHTNITKQI